MRNVHAHTFNAITEALLEAKHFVPLDIRQAVAAAVQAAIEPEIRADEQERIAREIVGYKTPCPVHGDLTLEGLACWHCSFNAGLHKSARVAYGQAYPAKLPGAET